MYYYTKMYARKAVTIRCDSKFSLFKLPIYKATNKVLLPTESKRILVDDNIYRQIQKSDMQFGYITDFSKDPALVTIVDHVVESYSKIGTIAKVDTVERTHNHMHALTVHGTQRFTVLNLENVERNVQISLSSFFTDVNMVDQENAKKEYDLYNLLVHIKEIYGSEYDIDAYLPLEVEEFKPNIDTIVDIESLEHEKHRREMFSFAVSNMVGDLGVPEKLALLHSQDSNVRLDWLLKSIIKPFTT